VLPVASTDEELDLGEERLKVRDVWHGELHKSVRTEEEVRDDFSEDQKNNKHSHWCYTFLVELFIIGCTRNR